MTPALTELMEKLAEKYETDMSGQSNYLSCKYDYQQGFTAAIEHVSKDCEFDGNASLIEAARRFDNNQPVDAWAFHDGAKWQFEQDRARVGLAEQRSWNAVEERSAVFTRNVMLVEQVESLEAKLAQALQRVAELEADDRLNCECPYLDRNKK